MKIWNALSRPHKAVNLETALLIAFGLGLWGLLASVDAFEAVVRFVEVHEDYELDELIIAIVICGPLGLLFAQRRHHETVLERKRREVAEQSSAWLANHDGLTGLPNRRFLADMGRQIHSGTTDAQSTPYLLITVDLSGFKQVNDLFGFQAGDELLMETAARIKKVLRDDLVVRTAGDEFCIVIRRSEATHPVAICNRLMDEICAPVTINGTQTMVGASVGYCFFPDDSPHFQEAVAFSSTAMFLAKQEKHAEARTRIVAFQPGMRDVVTRSARLERNLRQAVSDGVITPYYQPLVELDTGKIYGFEVLARWHDGDEGFIPPDEFIRRAEELGLICALSEQLLTKACRDAMSWPFPKSIAFNLSPSQFGDERVIDGVRRVLQATGLPPRRLEIEVTESAIIQNVGLACTLVETFNQLGVSVALDDFGTGYSSLAKLSRLPFSRLKIDRSFIAEMAKCRRQFHVVKAILDLGRGLGMLVTAEGIESEGQAKTLWLNGCNTGQGYYFGKAMTNEDVLRLLDQEVESASTTQKDAAPPGTEALAEMASSPSMTRE